MVKGAAFALTSFALVAIISASLAAETSYVPDRKILQQSDVAGSDYVTVLTVTTIAPNQTVARHTHPGVELSYIVEGEGVLTVEGKSQPVKPGMSFRVEPGMRHTLKNGPNEMKIVATYIIPKGAVLATPAPE